MGGLSPSQAKQQNNNSVNNTPKPNSPNSYGGPQAGDVQPTSTPSSFTSNLGKGGSGDRGSLIGPNPSGGNPYAKVQDKPSPSFSPSDAGYAAPPEPKKGVAPFVPKEGFSDPTKNTPKNSGSGFGAGRIKFDKSGNTLTDNKITSFAGQQAKETFLSNQGLGNNGTIVNQAKFAFADFRPLASYNLSGVAGDTKNPEPSPFVGEARVKQESTNQAYALLAKPTQEKTSGKTISGSNFGQNKFAPDTLIRGSAKEDAKKASEASRATRFYQVSKDQNSDYLTGGKPQGDKVDWVPPVGNHYFNMGQGINGPEYNKGTIQEQNAKLASAKASEASRASVFLSPGYGKEYGNNKVFTVGGPKNPVKENQVIAPNEVGKSYGTEWVNAQLGTKQNYRGNSVSTQAKITDSGKKAKEVTIDFNNPASIPLQNNLIQSSNNEIAISNAVIGLSNKDTRAANIKSEADLKSYFNQGNKEDATFVFYTGDKKSGYKEVGESSGPRSLYDFLSTEKKFGNVSLAKTYPKREQELSKAVGKNPDFYLGLPSSYWEALSKSGYYTDKNANKINSDLTTHFTAKNLGLMQGNLYSELHGGEVSGMSGPMYIPPPESEVASFIKTPYVGQKVSTSRVSSTSWVNIAQFAPGLPVIDRLAGPASEVWLNIIQKGSNKAGSLFNQGGIKFNNKIQEKAMENQYNFPKPQKTPTELIRPVNLQELEPVGLQIQKQTVGKRPQTELERTLANSPRPKENPNYEPNRNVFNPKPQPTFDINFKTETPVFRKTEVTSDILSPVEQAGRDRYPLMSNTIPESKPNGGPFDLSGKVSGRPPVRTSTKPDSNLSPVSREFFGVQFKGTYPTNYTPMSAGFINTGKTGKPIVSLGERGDYQDFRFRQFMESANTKGRFGFSVISQKEFPLPEETNPLGRRGKTPVKQSGSFDLPQSRAKVVEETQPRYQNEVFNAKGQSLSPSVLFGEIKPIGALGRKTVSKSSNSQIIDLEPRKDYQDWRFENYLKSASSKGKFGFSVLSKSEKSTDIVFNTGNKVTSPLNTNEKNYQQWRFEQFEKKNPPPESVGDKRFDTFVAKLPKGNKKAAVFSFNTNQKDLKVGFRRTSKPTFEEKPKEEKKTFEFKTTGSSQQQSVLLTKPLVRRRIVSSQEQQYEQGYEFKPVPESKSSNGLMSDLKIGTLSGLSFKSASQLKSGSMLANLNKTLSLSKPKSRLAEKQSSKLFSEQTTRQGSRQIPGILQTPKQTPKQKQTPSLIPKLPTPQRPRQSVAPKFDELPRFNFKQTTTPPKRVIVPPQLFGPFKEGRKSKSKSGPTGLIALNVNNIFSSSLSINVAKNRRIEF